MEDSTVQDSTQAAPAAEPQRLRDPVEPSFAASRGRLPPTPVVPAPAVPAAATTPVKRVVSRVNEFDTMLPKVIRDDDEDKEWCGARQRYTRLAVFCLCPMGYISLCPLQVLAPHATLCLLRPLAAALLQGTSRAGDKKIPLIPLWPVLKAGSPARPRCSSHLRSLCYLLIVHLSSQITEPPPDQSVCTHDARRIAAQRRSEADNLWGDRACVRADHRVCGVTTTSTVASVRSGCFAAPMWQTPSAAMLLTNGHGSNKSVSAVSSSLTNLAAYFTGEDEEADEPTRAVPKQTAAAAPAPAPAPEPRRKAAGVSADPPAAHVAVFSEPVIVSGSASSSDAQLAAHAAEEAEFFRSRPAVRLSPAPPCMPPQPCAPSSSTVSDSPPPAASPTGCA